jgi:hypothetical protein
MAFIAVVMLVAALVPATHRAAVASKVITLPRPGIRFSVPASWWMATEEFDLQNNVSSPPFPSTGIVTLTAGGEALCLAYVIFDPKYLPAQQQRYSDEPRYRRSRSLKRRRLLRGMEVLEFAYQKAVNPGTVTGVRGVLFERGRIECEITTSVKGNQEVVDRRMASFAPVFDMIVRTMLIQGPAGKIS